MAAHIKTFLEEAIELDEKGLFDINQKELFAHALNYAELGDNLEFEDWHELNDELSPKLFISHVKTLLPKYTKIWEELGKPKTVEEWKENQIAHFRAR